MHNYVVVKLFMIICPLTNINYHNFTIMIREKY